MTRHLWEDFKEAINANRLSDLGKRLYARRKETVERSFADAKELHGHRYARFRGLAKVQAQCLLSAACQNMKKMALLLARKAAALLLKILVRTRFAVQSGRYQGQSGTLYENASESASFRLDPGNLPDFQQEKQTPRKFGGSSAV